MRLYPAPRLPDPHPNRQRNPHPRPHHRPKGGISAIGTAFYYFYVPETKGRSLEQITLDFKLRAGEGDEAKANGSPVENPISGQAS